MTWQYLNATFLHLFSVRTGVVNYRGFHIKKQQVFHEMSPSKHSCCDSIWELRNENKEYFRGLLQFIVISGDSSKKNQYGKPGQPWRLPHREQFSGHIKESVQAVRIRSLILSLIRRRNFTFVPHEDLCGFGPCVGMGTTLVWIASLEAMFICSAPLRLLSFHVYTETELLWREAASGEQAEPFTCKPTQMINMTHLGFVFRVSWSLF